MQREAVSYKIPKRQDEKGPRATFMCVKEDDSVF